jgi:hypothetical protein
VIFFRVLLVGGVYKEVGIKTKKEGGGAMNIGLS